MTTRPQTSLNRRHFIGRVFMAMAGLSVLGWAKRSNAATQGTEPWLGEIMLWAGNFPPKFWALCNGQILPINQNQALFSLLGTTYGGNGVTTFALPDFRGRTPIHFGQGPGLSNRALGQVGGEENHTLIVAELPSHTHTARGSTAAGTSASPAGMVVARNAAQIPQYGATVDAALAPQTIANTGGSQAHPNMQPYLVLNYVICINGLFPS